jgi:hypothetical protein
MFDLMTNCPLLVKHIADRKVGFGINHEMRDFKTGRKKNLDLVICTPAAQIRDASVDAFADLVSEWHIELSPKLSAILDQLPSLVRVPVGSVHVALEAKACMTAHIKALPRLYDELNSSHLAIHGSADFAIAAGLVTVNVSNEFISPGKNAFAGALKDPNISRHNQPRDAERTVEKIREIPRRTQMGTEGFDALGIVVVNAVNDGSPIYIYEESPAPQHADVLHYDQMIHRIASLYASKFQGV